MVVVVSTNPVKPDDLHWLRHQPYDYVLMTKMSPRGDKHNLDHNWGSEASSYLHFILTHWDHLPERMVFLHGHWHSWHSWVRAASYSPPSPRGVTFDHLSHVRDCEHE